LNKEGIAEKIIEMIENMCGVKVKDRAASLFGREANLSAEYFIYLLIQIRDDFDVIIDDDFVDSLKEYSVANLVELVAESGVSSRTN